MRVVLESASGGLRLVTLTVQDQGAEEEVLGRRVAGLAAKGKGGNVAFAAVKVVTGPVSELLPATNWRPFRMMMASSGVLELQMARRWKKRKTLKNEGVENGIVQDAYDTTSMYRSRTWTSA
jgi:hypothetical protein